VTQYSGPGAGTHYQHPELNHQIPQIGIPSYPITICGSSLAESLTQVWEAVTCQECLKRKPAELIHAQLLSFIEKRDTAEKVDHPAHYGGADNPYEAIKVIVAWKLGFCLGSALKYICRAGLKPGESTLDDLRKAAWYLQREIAELEAKETAKP